MWEASHYSSACRVSFSIETGADLSCKNVYRPKMMRELTLFVDLCTVICQYNEDPGWTEHKI